MAAKYGSIRKDQYYNMYDIIQDNMECVNVAKAAMEKAGITPISCDPYPWRCRWF